MKKFKKVMLLIGAGMVGIVYLTAALYISAEILHLICRMG